MDGEQLRARASSACAPGVVTIEASFLAPALGVAFSMPPSLDLLSPVVNREDSRLTTFASEIRLPRMEPIKCGCGLVHELASWAALQLVGYQEVPPFGEEPGWTIELRNCSCGSTICRERHPPDRLKRSPRKRNSNTPYRTPEGKQWWE